MALGEVGNGVEFAYAFARHSSATRPRSLAMGDPITLFKALANAAAVAMTNSVTQSVVRQTPQSAQRVGRSTQPSRHTSPRRKSHKHPTPTPRDSAVKTEPVRSARVGFYSSRSEQPGHPGARLRQAEQGEGRRGMCVSIFTSLTRLEASQGAGGGAEAVPSAATTRGGPRHRMHTPRRWYVSHTTQATSLEEALDEDSVVYISSAPPKPATKGSISIKKVRGAVRGGTDQG